MIHAEIMLPDHAPRAYLDRQVLWNAVEKAEKNKKAQLAYSFDIALQNEFTKEENIALVHRFLTEQLLGRGMIVDYAIHEPDTEDGGISNPHFHVLCPIRPIEKDGTWGNKQRREYGLDEQGNRIRDEAGNYVFNTVPTTDWGRPETLEAWRQAWAELCNAKFEEKGLPCRIDHRSYERQGLDIIPTRHEGPTVRAMEAKGIPTNKGELNRWIRKTNALLREAKQKITTLLDLLKAIKAEMVKPREPTLSELLNAHLAQRNAGAWSNTAKVNNLKEQAQMKSPSSSSMARLAQACALGLLAIAGHSFLDLLSLFTGLFLDLEDQVRRALEGKFHQRVQEQLCFVGSETEDEFFHGFLL